MSKVLADLLPGKTARSLAYRGSERIVTLYNLIELCKRHGMRVKKVLGKYYITGLFDHMSFGGVGEKAWASIQDMFETEWPEWKDHAYISGAHCREGVPISAMQLSAVPDSRPGPFHRVVVMEQSISERADFLDQMFSDGWRLLTVDGNVAYFRKGAS